MKRTYLKLTICLLLILQANLACGQQKEQTTQEEFKLESVELEDESSGYLTLKAWEASGEKNYQAVEAYAKKCIDLYGDEARRQQRSLSDFPPLKKQSAFDILNNVATCYFIRAEALMRQGKGQEAREIFQLIIDEYSFAQCWDPRGWYWKVAEKSRQTIEKIDKGTAAEITGHS